jgi:hypothetical protein
VRPHLGQAFLFTTDICDFYPSVHRQRIFDLFTGLDCAPSVAHHVTRLTTWNHRLAQGLLTSPILADYLMRPVDERISRLCASCGLIYTRFVDDLAVSGPFNLEQSGIPSSVERILRENGFSINEGKRQFGTIAGGATVTNLRFPNGHPDVRKSYYDEVVRQLEDAIRLAQGGSFDGPYFTEGQVCARVQFICWVNPGRRRRLQSLVRRVNWDSVRAEAQRQGLEVVVKRLVRLTGASQW